MGKTLYLECNSGISGDMTVGALLDLGADQVRLEEALSSLDAGQFSLRFGRTAKCGIDAFDFDVVLEEGAICHSHEHMEESHICGDNHEEESHGGGEDGHGCHAHMEDGHVHGHHGHVHGPHVHGGEGHPHIHRNLDDVFQIIDRFPGNGRVRDLSKRIFTIVAEAESKAHGIPVEEVHFHEVGAVDSIVDILSVAWCLEDLGVDRVIVSPLSEGYGTARCQHGVIPVPVPATANIAMAYGLELRRMDCEGEMVTPTGAAIAAALGGGRRLPERYLIRRIGIGAGNKDFPHANILRAMIIEEPWESREAGMWKLETNVDDCSPECLGFVMERLLEAGAADVWFTPAYMKKNRPAYEVKVLCGEGLIGCMEELLFRHTTTIGVRRYPVERTALRREEMTVETPYGPARVKVCRHGGGLMCYPEYEGVRQLCLQASASGTGHGGPAGFTRMYHMVMEIAISKMAEMEDVRGGGRHE